METVFDLNITADEMKYIGIEDKALYLSIAGVHTANQDIAALYHLRGNEKMMRLYADKLLPNMKNDLYRTIFHP